MPQLHISDIKQLGDYFFNIIVNLFYDFVYIYFTFSGFINMNPVPLVSKNALEHIRKLII
jgi:hypothetical protein